jgi:hypothetical protein
VADVSLDAARTALAFVRAFADGDSAGASSMLSTLPVDELVDFCGFLATTVQSALEVGDIDPGRFFDALGALIETRDQPHR